MTTKWKCNVCGEIFSHLPKICPVCGAKKSAFSLYEEEETTFRKDSDEKLVIAGGGIAALEAARAIRARNKTADIVMVIRENRIPYNRPALSDLICKGLSFADIVLENYNFYKQNNIKIIKNVEALDINEQQKSLLLSNGESLPYDKLCIATGADAFNPFKISDNMIPVITLRSFEDAENVLKLMKDKGNRVVIAGGGILGIEAADALNNIGAKVTVIERNSFIVKAQLDEYAATKLKQNMHDSGVTVITDKTITQIDNKGVTLSDNEIIEADFMLVSMGVRSQITLAKKTSIKTDRAIIVDEYMRTNNQEIFAAGDCAEYDGKSGGLWIISSAQGKVAGANMAGDKIKYRKVPLATAFEGFGLNFFSVGDINSAQKTEVFQQKNIYKKLSFIDNKLAGVLLLGDTSLSNKALTLVTNQASYGDALSLIND